MRCLKKSNKINNLRGGSSLSLHESLCRPYILPDDITFAHTPPFKDFFVLHQKYVVEGLSIRQIANEFLSSKEAVRMGLINAGIPLREQCKPHGRKSQLKFGERLVKEKLVSFNKEQKIIEAIQQMSAQSLSMRQIAKNLSAMGVPTKANGKKWHPEMIRRILENST